MGISFNETSRVFHLQAEDTSYIFQIHELGFLEHLYWGKKIRNGLVPHVPKSNGIAFSPALDGENPNVFLDLMSIEYPAYGNGDLREPAYHVQLENGSTITELKYFNHRIFKGKPSIEGLPATYVENEEEAETLEIELVDSLINLKVMLSYTVFENYNAITRSVKFINDGNEDLKLLRALSMCVDFKDADYEFLHLSGAWARERDIHKRDLKPGFQSVSSRRGASSHQQNPFIALLERGANEKQGEVYGFSLVYSGNFVAQAEVDQMYTTRVTMGINPFDFSWLLKPQESFQTPEVVIVYSDSGLGQMSRTYHKLYRTRLCRGKFRDKVRPVLINNWEATYFKFNAQKIEEIARAGKELGIELFVLDDGWFGKRDNDRSSLGDWFVDKNKLPEGLDALAKNVESLGMKFGLWFEPEMISPDSDLYRAHPDWCLHVPNRRRSEGRNQLILDFSREEVCNAIIKMVSDILASAPITYVKWDMNRHMTEIGSAMLPAERQRETAHRYMLGLYKVMDKITSSFPHVLFESCSGGGGRFDPGILYYMPQTWTSDDSDAVERLKIQYGTSIVYPISSMGAHVSAVPNHQVHRITPLETRGNVAMSGNFGYELDLTKFTDEEKAIVKQQVAFYKENRSLIMFGDFYRLLSPFEGNDTAWMIVSEDKKEAIVFYFRIMGIPNEPLGSFKLQGLNTEVNYKLVGSEEVYGGDELMYSGLTIPLLRGDYQSYVWKFVISE